MALLELQKLLDTEAYAGQGPFLNRALQKLKAAHEAGGTTFGVGKGYSTTEVANEEDAFIFLIRRAITERIQLQLRYRSGAIGGTTERFIRPMALFFTQDYWVLVGYCLLREALREFRLDRVLSLTPTAETFPPNQFSLSDYFKEKPSF